MQRGKFIVIEGVDGAGKTTQIKRLTERLRAEGIEVYLTSEPTCKATEHAPTAAGSIIADVLLGKIKMTASAMAGLFLTDRILHNTDEEIGIRGLLERGVWVVCDRYYYSSFAYQGLECDVDWVISANLQCPDITKPDVCVFLDLSPEVAQSRREARGEEIEIFERPEIKTSSIRDKFFYVFSKLSGERIEIVSADGTIDEVSERIYSVVKDI